VKKNHPRCAEFSRAFKTRLGEVDPKVKTVIGTEAATPYIPWYRLAPASHPGLAIGYPSKLR
jgi:hypothetical protein